MKRWPLVTGALLLAAATVGLPNAARMWVDQQPYRAVLAHLSDLDPVTADQHATQVAALPGPHDHGKVLTDLATAANTAGLTIQGHTSSASDGPVGQVRWAVTLTHPDPAALAGAVMVWGQTLPEYADLRQVLLDGDTARVVMHTTYAQ